jgi:thiamine biosynthesis protein ThiS
MFREIKRNVNSEKMLKVTLNKKEIELAEGTKVTELLESLNNKKAVVWINGTQLLKAEYDSRVIVSGDVLRVFRMIAGG